MHQLPLVSVIITTFNRKEFLKKTLNSIVSQTYHNMEILIIDDGSIDGTSNDIKMLSDDRIQFHQMKHSGRPAVPRNYGLSKAKGDLIAFCDDDDIWDIEKIALQVKTFKNNPDIQLCYTSTSYIDEYDGSLSSLQNLKKENPTTFNAQLYHNKITFSSLMIRRNIFLNGHQFDERLCLKASEDFLFITKIVAKYPIYYINSPLLKYRVHKDGISHNHTNIKKLMTYYFRLLRCFYNLLEERYISIFKFFHLFFYHLVHINKQIFYLLFQHIKKM